MTTKKDYFNYSVALEEFPKDYYYTTVKIDKSKKCILIFPPYSFSGKFKNELWSISVEKNSGNATKSNFCQNFER